MKLKNFIFIIILILLTTSVFAQNNEDYDAYLENDNLKQDSDKSENIYEFQFVLMSFRAIFSKETVLENEAERLAAGNSAYLESMIAGAGCSTDVDSYGGIAFNVEFRFLLNIRGK